jgi:colanic acid biosynthesis protein WcaH
MLDKDIFRTVVNSTPLISIDLLIKMENKILLGKRVNKPAKDAFFSIGGRIWKNERIEHAMARIASDELGLKLKTIPEFIGVFEHIYNDGIFEDVSTHYINLAYGYNVQKVDVLPHEQHCEYKWFTVNELMQSQQVHEYVKDYFRG